MRLCMIEIDSRHPCDRRMAAVALFRGQDVICRLRGRAHLAADAVARRTLPRSAFENGTRVALLARQVAVLASQLKAGRQMVELGALLRAEGRRRKRKCEQKCHKQGECTHVIT